MGNEVDWNEFLSLTANRGTIVVLALPLQPMTLNAGELIMRQVNVTGSLIGGSKITAEMLEFASKHGIRPWIEKYSMSDINQAVQHVIDGNPRYRVVMETETAARI